MLISKHTERKHFCKYGICYKMVAANLIQQTYCNKKSKVLSRESFP